MQADNKRESLLEAAVKVAATEGLDKVTTKAISVESGLNEVYIYRCFKNKEDLLKCAFEQKDMRLISFVFSHLPILKVRSLSLENRCWTIWSRCWRFMLNDPEGCRFYVQYYYSVSFKKYAAKENAKRFSIMVEELRKCLELDDDIQLLSHHIFESMILYVVRVADGRLPDTEETSRRIFNLLFASVRPGISKNS